MNVISRFIPPPIKRSLKKRLERMVGTTQENSTASFAQEGEDIVLSRLFGMVDRTTNGFYVDVGAHHPSRYSNTYYFYLRNWTGINIDAMPGSMASFRVTRPKDINLEVAISDVEQLLTYYEFNEPALNGFCEELARQRDKYLHFKLVSTRQIETRRLSQILEQHIKTSCPIDFLTVDVEGLDIEVLKSNDWSKFRPKLVLAEDVNAATVQDACKSEVAKYMFEQGYELLSKTALTLFFAAPEYIETGATGVRIAS